MKNRPFARTDSLPASSTNAAAASATAWLSLWMRMSGTAGILLLAGTPAPGVPHSWTPSRRARREGLRQRLNRRDRVLPQGQDDGLLIVSLEGLYVSGCLGLREGAKGVRFSGNPEIGNHLIDELQE